MSTQLLKVKYNPALTTKASTALAEKIKGKGPNSESLADHIGELVRLSNITPVLARRLGKPIWRWRILGIVFVTLLVGLPIAAPFYFHWDRAFLERNVVERVSHLSFEALLQTVHASWELLLALGVAAYSVLKRENTKRRERWIDALSEFREFVLIMIQRQLAVNPGFDGRTRDLSSASNEELEKMEARLVDEKTYLGVCGAMLALASSLGSFLTSGSRDGEVQSRTDSLVLIAAENRRIIISKIERADLDLDRIYAIRGTA